MVHLVGLGYGDGRHMSLSGADAMLASRLVILRTARCGAVERLTAMDIAYEACDDLYEASEGFDELALEIARRVLEHAKKGGDIAFASPGGAGIGDAVMQRVMALLGDAGMAFTAHPAAGIAEGLALEAGGVDQAMIAFAFDAPTWHMDVRKPLIILELDQAVLASEVKTLLLDAYPDDHGVLLRTQQGEILRVELPEIDRQPSHRYGIEAAVLVPSLTLAQCRRYDVGHLEEIMAILRGREGCPWDREQTHESLKTSLIEEAWEALAAIESGDPDRMADELGDVLLQVAFHAQIARERGDFTMDDVATAICRKLITRHPHIFGDVFLDPCGNATGNATGDDSGNAAAQVVANWEAIKKVEKGLTTKASAMEDVPSSFPGLLRAQKVQGKAEDKNADLLAAAVGDMLFAASRVARQSGINAELSLHQAIEQFIRAQHQYE